MTYAEQMPSFRGGGVPELLAYLQKKLRRPENTGGSCVAGKVYVSFVVDTAGGVRDVRLVKALSRASRPRPCWQCSR